MGRGSKKITEASGGAPSTRSGALHTSGASVLDPDLSASNGFTPEEYKNEAGAYHREDGPARVFPDGREEWYRHGVLHREDGPARVFPDGREEFYIDGALHRVDGPARVFPDGREEWYTDGVMFKRKDFLENEHGIYTTYYNSLDEVDNPAGPAIVYIRKDKDTGEPVSKREEWIKEGMLHRVDGPAILDSDSGEAWYRDGKLHRSGGPAKTGADGEEWWTNGYLHRAGGPAITRADGKEEWWLNGELHREDGPARIFPDGTREYWLNGAEVTPSEFREYRESRQDSNHDSDDDQEKADYYGPEV